MHDGAPGAADRLEAALDQLGARLGQHLDGDVLGHEIALDQLADKGEIGLGRGRKADLDLLEAELDQKVEHPPLAVGSHRLDQRLIAVAQVDAAPERRAVDNLDRPASVGQIDRRKGTVLVDRHAGHRSLLLRESPPGQRLLGRDRGASRPAGANAAGRR